MDYLSRAVDELEISVRVAARLRYFGITTIGQLTEKTAAELLAGPNFGHRSLAEIKSILAAMGLSLRPQDVDNLKQPRVENC